MDTSYKISDGAKIGIFAGMLIVLILFAVILFSSLAYNAQKNNLKQQLMNIAPVTNSNYVGLGQDCSGTSKCMNGLVCDPTQLICKNPQPAAAAVAAAVQAPIVAPTNSGQALFAPCLVNSDCQSGMCSVPQFYHLCDVNALNTNKNPDLTGETIVPLLVNAKVPQVELIGIPNTKDLLLLNADGTLVRIKSDGTVVSVPEPVIVNDNQLIDIASFNGQLYGIDEAGTFGSLDISNPNATIWNPFNYGSLTPIQYVYSQSPDGKTLQLLDTNNKIVTLNTQKFQSGIDPSQTTTSVIKIFNDNGISMTVNPANNSVTIDGTNQVFNNVIDAALTNTNRVILLNTTQGQHIQNVYVVNDQPFYLLNPMCVQNYPPNFKL